MVLTSDHISGATGKTVSVELSQGPAAAGTAAAGTVSELDSSNLPGVYQIALTTGSTGDVGTLGDLWFRCTASGCDPTDFCDQVQSQTFTDLSISGGQVSIQSQVKRNTQFLLPFIMTLNGIPQLGLAQLAAQRSIDLGSFANCSNTVTELGHGWYGIILTASDTNGTVIALRITATSADDKDITLYTQP